MHRNHLGSLLKCRLNLINLGWGLRIPISTTLPEQASGVGLQTRSNSQILDHNIPVKVPYGVWKFWLKYQICLNKILKASSQWKLQLFRKSILLFNSLTFKNLLFCIGILLLFSRSAMSDSLQPHGLQYARLPYPLPSSGVCSNSCPLSWWCHPTISSSLTAFFSCLQSFPASGSFPMSQLFASGSQSIGASASAPVLPMNQPPQVSFCLNCTSTVTVIMWWPIICILFGLISEILD